MGVLSDGTSYLNQRGLAALCGLMNAHMTTSLERLDAECGEELRRIGLPIVEESGRAWRLASKWSDYTPENLYIDFSEKLKKVEE